MKELTNTFTYTSLSEGDFISFEAKFHLIFPENFKLFLLKHNGGDFKEVVYYREDGIFFYITHFYPIWESPNGSIDEQMEFVNDIFIKYIPFGFDPGGWIYCISIEVEWYEYVFIFRLDRNYDEAFESLGVRFSEFIDNLEPEK